MSKEHSPDLKPEVILWLSQNWILRLLIKGGNRFAVYLALAAIGYWAVGIPVAQANQALLPYLKSPYPYLQTLAFILGVFTATWYVQVLATVLSDIPKAFEVEKSALQQIIVRWLLRIRPVFLLVLGVVSGAFMVWGSLLREKYESGLLGLLPPWSSMTVHFQIMVALCGIMFSAGVYLWIRTLGLLKRLFQLNLNLFRYRYLYSLSAFSTGMTVACLFAVALFIGIIFLQQDNPGAVVTCLLGIIFAALVFVIPQLSYQNSVIRAKRSHLNALGTLREQQYEVLKLKQPSADVLQEAKLAIEALDALEKSVNTIPEWLVGISDAVRVLLSLLLPLGTTLLNYLLSRIP